MNFIEILESKNINPEEYLQLAKKAAKSNGYNPKMLEFSDKPKYKLKYDGVYFGAVLYNDYISYTLLHKQGLFSKDYVDSRRRSYLARSAGSRSGQQPCDQPDGAALL